MIDSENGAQEWIKCFPGEANKQPDLKKPQKNKNKNKNY